METLFQCWLNVRPAWQTIILSLLSHYRFQSVLLTDRVIEYEMSVNIKNFVCLKLTNMSNFYPPRLKIDVVIYCS